jgi:hypothetical protein
MKKLIFGLATFQLVAGTASAAEPLSDAQLDRITAGALAPIMIDCPGCVSASSGQNSMTANGVTMVMTTGGTSKPEDTGGNTANNGVSGNPAEEQLSAALGGSITNISPVPFPANLVTAITALGSFNPTQP